MNPILVHGVRRASGLFRLLRWWGAAEKLCAIGPADGERNLRLGQIREHRANWTGAEAVYRKAIELDDTKGVYYFRLGRVLERQGDKVGAADAYSSAIKREADAAEWRRRRAKIAEKLDDWNAAVEEYRVLVTLEPDRKETHLQLGRALERIPDPLGAIEVYETVTGKFGDDLNLARKIAWNHKLAGDWTTACRMLRELLAIDSTHSETKHRYAVSLERQARVPFELQGETVVMTSAGDGLDDAYKYFEAGLAGTPERVTRFHRLAGRQARKKRLNQIASRTPVLARRVKKRVAGPETRLRRVHNLGRMYERHGRFKKAAAKYRAAVKGLADVDAIWVHSAEPTWKFRLAYAEERIEPSAEAASLLRRSIRLGEPASSAADPGGFFEPVVMETGMRITGFVVPGAAESVDLYLDGELVKSVAVNQQEWLRPFTFHLSHRVLTEFPVQGRLTLRAGDRPLLAAGGTDTVYLEIPDGTGHLSELLATGYGINKKGALSSPPAQIAKNQMRYLEAYDEAKDVFEKLLGKHLFLIYGTLLGCYRDGTFIPNDDDFDVAYVCDATDPVEVKNELWRDALKLIRAGYDVSMTVTGRLFKIRFGDAWFDVNAMWFFRGRAWSFETHDLRPADVEPAATMDFLGHEVYVPKDSEAFLRDNYGPGWRTPQSDFRYYRAESDRRVMRRSWLTPSEARAFAREAEEELGQNSSAGKFVGISDPADTGFVT